MVRGIVLISILRLQTTASACRGLYKPKLQLREGLSAHIVTDTLSTFVGRFSRKPSPLAEILKSETSSPLIDVVCIKGRAEPRRVRLRRRGIFETSVVQGVR
jgi:hypothetical protein